MSVVEFLEARCFEGELTAGEDYVPAEKQPEIRHLYAAIRAQVARLENCSHPPRVGGWCHACDLALRTLAAVHADHPDYNPDWRP